MKNLKVVSLCLLLSVFTSCAVSYDILFEDDLSGHVDFVIGPASGFPVPQANGQAMEPPPERVEQRTTELNELDGVSNANIEPAGDGWLMAADFEDLDALNAFFRNTDFTRRMIGDSIPVIFSAAGDSVVLDGRIMVPWSKMGMGAAVQSVDEAKMMLDMFEVDVALSFAESIQSIDVHSAELLDQDEHTVRTEVNMREFYDDGLRIVSRLK